MNITVSKIESRLLRRLVIAGTYPILAILGFPLLFVFQVVPRFFLMVVWDWCGWQKNLASSAKKEWKK